jgi:peptidoglycan hydrolase-like protein with peptidoglycan-binding domain
MRVNEFVVSELDLLGEGMLDSVTSWVKDKLSGTAASSTSQPVKYEIGSRGPIIADLQKVLTALGYGSTAGPIDGIFGNGTKQAIAKFQADNQLSGTTGKVDLETIKKLNELIKTKLAGQLIKSSEEEFKQGSSGKPTAPSAVKPIANSKTIAAGRKAAEQYLGRPLDEQEWPYLIRAVAGEASNNSTEQAWVMGVILNRVRSNNPTWGSDVVSVLTAENQFQAVTGKPGVRGSSPLFNNPGSKVGSIVNAAITKLSSVPHEYMHFTAANEKAYTKGTNIGFKKGLEKQDSAVQIGGTIFAH